MAKHSEWYQVAFDEFGITQADAINLRRISKQLHSYDMLSMNDRELTVDESEIEHDLICEVEAICRRYNIPQSDGDSVGYEFPDPRSGSGLRFVLPSGYKNSLGGYNL